MRRPVHERQGSTLIQDSNSFSVNQLLGQCLPERGCGQELKAKSANLGIGTHTTSFGGSPEPPEPRRAENSLIPLSHDHIDIERADKRERRNPPKGHGQEQAPNKS